MQIKNAKFTPKGGAAVKLKEQKKTGAKGDFTVSVNGINVWIVGVNNFTGAKQIK